MTPSSYDEANVANSGAFVVTNKLCTTSSALNMDPKSLYPSNPSASHHRMPHANLPLTSAQLAAAPFALAASSAVASSFTLGTSTAVLPNHLPRLLLKLVWSILHDPSSSQFDSYMTPVAFPAGGEKNVRFAAPTSPTTRSSHAAAAASPKAEEYAYMFAAPCRYVATLYDH